jgi:hypothetical protein
MSPTLLEFAVAIILIVVAWQIGLAIAPSILRVLRTLKRDVDEATDEAFVDLDTTDNQQPKEEHSNGTRG